MQEKVEMGQLFSRNSSSVISDLKNAQSLLRQKNFPLAERLLREILQQESEIKQSREPGVILDSIYYLGLAFFEQKKYQEAIQTFTKLAEEQRKGNVKKFDYEIMLAYSFWKRRSDDEAMDISQKIVQNSNCPQTVHKAKLLMAHLYFDQAQYLHAMSLYKDVAHKQEELSGQSSNRTLLRTKYWIAKTLFKLERYTDAKKVSTETIKVSQTTFQQSCNQIILDTRFLHACTLYHLEKYRKAEPILKDVIKVQESKLERKESVKGNRDLALGKFYLGCTKYNQRDYPNARVVFQDASQNMDKTFGKGHEKSLSCKQWLATTLRNMHQNSDAAEIEHEVKDIRKTFHGQSHFSLTNTIEREKQPPLQFDSIPLIPIEKDVVVRLAQYFTPQKRKHSQPYTNSEIGKIQSLLNSVDKNWANSPKLYTLSRNIESENLIDQLMQFGVSDYSFPLTMKNFPGHFDQAVCLQFIDTQRLVISKYESLERDGKGQHYHFTNARSVPFKRGKILGKGGFGTVHQIQCRKSTKEYARKRFRRSAFVKGGREDLKYAIKEIEILKRINHKHIVEFVGSYTDDTYIGIIMKPVAEMNLSEYLANDEPTKYQELRRFVGCLLKTLAFIHEQKIRHKDIKPANILVHHGTILFTDFGIANDFVGANGSTTTGTVTAFSKPYAAPEVMSGKKRNISSDIWSLGVVFLEIAVKLQDKGSDYMQKYFVDNGNHKKYLSENFEALESIIAELRKTTDSPENIQVIGLAEKMLQKKRKSRPDAKSLFELIVKDGEANAALCEQCCRRTNPKTTDLPS